MDACISFLKGLAKHSIHAGYELTTRHVATSNAENLHSHVMRIPCKSWLKALVCISGTKSAAQVTGLRSRKCSAWRHPWRRQTQRLDVNEGDSIVDDSRRLIFIRVNLLPDERVPRHSGGSGRYFSAVEDGLVAFGSTVSNAGAIKANETRPRGWHDYFSKARMNDQGQDEGQVGGLDLEHMQRRIHFFALRQTELPFNHLILATFNNNLISPMSSIVLLGRRFDRHPSMASGRSQLHRNRRLPSRGMRQGGID